MTVDKRSLWKKHKKLSEIIEQLSEMFEYLDAFRNS